MLATACSRSVYFSEVVTTAVRKCSDGASNKRKGTIDSGPIAKQSIEHVFRASADTRVSESDIVELLHCGRFGSVSSNCFDTIDCSTRLQSELGGSLINTIFDARR
jgi:hypothetical protein